MSISDDAMETFNFTVPMYLSYNEDGTLIRRENPIWYTISGGDLIKNMRKIKVIFNKTVGTEE